MAQVVIDASVLVDSFIGPELTPRLRSLDLHAPTLIDYEFMSAVRRRAGSEMLQADIAEEIIADYATIEISRHSAGPLLARMWALRHNVTAYDASYVALAASLNVPLMTSDRRLARAAADYCEVIAA